MAIRLLELRNADECLQLRFEALKTNPEAFGSSYEDEVQNPANKYVERLQSPNHFLFGAYEDEKLVGMVELIKQDRLKYKHKALIVGMYVSPEYRGKGLGRALLEAAVNQAKTIDETEQVLLSVVTTNEKAKSLYESLGFESYGVEPRCLKLGDTYYDQHFMVLFL